MSNRALFSILCLFFLSVPLTAGKIVFLGDSLTAGYGLDPEYAFPKLVEKALQEENSGVTVINAGLSGDTSAGGLQRMDWILRQSIDVFVVALGANDALRGLPIESTRDNLKGIVEKVRSSHPEARIILAGMLAPPNMGEAYRAAFDKIYPEVAEAESIELIPFLLDGVAGDAKLNLADGIHPNAAGHQKIARIVLKQLRENEGITYRSGS